MENKQQIGQASEMSNVLSENSVFNIDQRSRSNGTSVMRSSRSKSYTVMSGLSS